MSAVRECGLPDCRGAHKARDRCDRHYRQLLRAERGSDAVDQVPDEAAPPSHAEAVESVRSMVARLDGTARRSWQAQLALSLAGELEAGGPLLPIVRELRIVMAELEQQSPDPDDDLAAVRAQRAARLGREPS